MLNNSPAADMLAAAQNADGGWGYNRNSSWTEPTVYALLALSTCYSAYRPAIERGLRWLPPLQRDDGGWRPRPGVHESTWVTALLLLLPEGMLDNPTRRRTAEWLIEQTPATAAWRYRVPVWMSGGDTSDHSAGWSWFPGTAAWVTPTSVGILALRKLNRQTPHPRVNARIDQATDFLLRHACAQGGWNHGSSRALGYDLGPYPETTGIGLLATTGVRAPEISKAIAAAEKSWINCRSTEGQSWLRLGLMAHGLPDPASAETNLPCRTNTDLALTILADAAHRRNNVFLS